MSRAGVSDQLVIGKIVGVHGLTGWLKVNSFAEPREQIFEYSTLTINGQRFDEFEGGSRGKGLRIKLAGIDDRTAAEQFLNADISIDRSDLAVLDPGSYYHADLIGLAVVNRDGDPLGTVADVLRTGANDVLDLGEGQLIPFTVGHVVDTVDLDAGVISVDWDQDWF